jgi:hypothetical protein
MPPEIGRAIGELPGSSRRSTQVVKKYDESQSLETFPGSRPSANNEPAPVPVDEPALCSYSEETVAGCLRYRAISEHGDFPDAAECQSVLVVPVSSHQRQRICRRVGGHTEP